MMFDQEEEKEYLAIADKRISELGVKIELLMRSVADSTEVDALMKASELLAITHEVLETMKIFRSQVLRRLRTADGTCTDGSPI